MGERRASSDTKKIVDWLKNESKGKVFETGKVATYPSLTIRKEK